MAVVSLKIGGKFYKFSCNDGQEPLMRELADALDKRAEALTKSLGYIQEGQLLAMLCLILAGEKHLLEKSTNASVVEQTTDALTQSLRNLATKIDVLAESLEQ